MEHENAIFGSSKQPSLDKSEYVNITLGRAADSLINPSVLSTSNKSIMHENVIFKDNLNFFLQFQNLILKYIYLVLRRFTNKRAEMERKND